MRELGPPARDPKMARTGQNTVGSIVVEEMQQIGRCCDEGKA